MTYSQQIQQLNVIDKTEQTYRFLIKSEKEKKTVRNDKWFINTLSKIRPRIYEAYNSTVVHAYICFCIS